MARYCFYVDGFNVYHAIAEYYPEYKWLNYGRLAEQVIGPKDTLENVVYFTAFAKWKPNHVKRHEHYIKALRSAKVEVVYGRFLDKRLQCHLCKRFYKTHVEKRSDVNIAVRVLSDAVLDCFDRAMLVTADSDLLPVIEGVHRLSPDKEVGVMFPTRRTSTDLKQNADFRREMPERLLRESQFPDEFTVGGSLIKRPIEWPLG